MAIAAACATAVEAIKLGFDEIRFRLGERDRKRREARERRRRRQKKRR